ncbi:MAG: serine/threonine protein kinase [Sandaracinaceae bacterium]|nr:serine/threonine protein kinase [Sandaracinaceae bacterium]
MAGRKDLLRDTLGPYRIERRLAAGGMAEVFVALRQGPHGFQKRVALKRILPQHARDAEFVGMFIDEARLAARLDHPGVVQVFDFGEHGGALFMAMEMVEGTTVGRLLRAVAGRRETVPLGPALHIAYEAAAALAYAHELCDDEGRPLHIVHRDVSPANLLLDRSGRVRLTDFGIARCRTTVSRTDDGHIRGKLGYMSPEQVVGDPVDAKSDVFTLGVVLAELLLAEPLFGKTGDLEVLLQIRNVDLSTLHRRGSHIPKDVQRLIIWALERDARHRPSARTFEQAIREILLRRGELGHGPRECARLLERLELIPKAARDVNAQEAGARPTFLVDLDDSTAASDETRSLLDDLSLDPPTMYELRLPDGSHEGPIPFSDMVRRIVLGELQPGTQVRKDTGDFDSAGRMPELQRYLKSNALHWGPAGPPEGASRRGVLQGGRLLKTVHGLTVGRETGVLHLWDGGRQKRIFFREGRPDFVASNIGAELLGEFLVAQGSILRMELDMALAMLTRYEGRLGDALVGLGILRPMELYKAVSQQVRARYLEAFQWSRGQWAYVSGECCEEETLPIGQGEHELLRDAALTTSPEQLKLALRPVQQRLLRLNPQPPAPIAQFRVPPEWERVLSSLDGHTTPAGLLAREYARGGLDAEQVERALYLALSCELVAAA